MMRCRNPLVLALTVACMVALAACPRRVETSEPGPGGLPRSVDPRTEPFSPPSVQHLCRDRLILRARMGE